MLPRIRPITAVILIVALLVLAPSVAVAGGTSASVNDRDDVSGPLDIRSLEISRAASNNPLDLVLAFYRAVPAKRFDSGGHAYLYFDSDDDPEVDWTGSVVRGENGLVLVLTGPGSTDRIPMSRPNDHALAVELQGSTGPNPNGPVRVFARATYHHRRGPCKRTCRDRAPDAGSLGL